MDKKMFGIKFGAFLTVLLALVCAVVLWLYVKIAPVSAVSSSLAHITRFLR